MGNPNFATIERWTTTLLVAGIVGVGSASATLLDRGGGLIYDNVLNITWLQDGNYAKTSGFDLNGAMPWPRALAWAAGLSYFDSVRNVTYSDWRLPYASVIAGPGPLPDLGAVVQCTGAGGADELLCRDNEMGYMYYYNLDATHGQDMTGDHTADGVNLFDIGQIVWSGTDFGPTATSDDLAWDFRFISGDRARGSKTLQLFTWAVRAGDVGAQQEPNPIPEPGSVLLLGLGALAFGLSRRTNAEAYSHRRALPNLQRLSSVVALPGLSFSRRKQ